MTRRALLWSAGFMLLLLLALQLVGVDQAEAALARLSWPLIAAVVTLSLGNYALRMLRWQFLCRHVGVEVPLGRNALYYVAGFAFTITPGKIGEVVRLWFLRRGHGYGYDRTAGLMVLDRLTDAWPLLLLALLGVVQFASQGLSLVLAAAVLGLGTVVMLHPSWIRTAIKLAYGRVRRAPRLFARLVRASRVLARFASPSALTPPLALGIVGWLCEIVGAWLILDALGAPVPLTAAAFVFGFGMLVGAVPVFPGGVGGAEGTMVALLVLLAVPLPTAIAATALIRLATLGLAVVLGFAALPFADLASRPALRPSPSSAMRA